MAATSDDVGLFEHAWKQATGFGLLFEVAR